MSINLDWKTIQDFGRFILWGELDKDCATELKSQKRVSVDHFKVVYACSVQKT